ncbi:hypothetical protein [Nocardia sp. NPDC004750]
MREISCNGSDRHHTETIRRARPLAPQRADTIQTEPPKLGLWPGLVEKYTKPEHGISFRDMQERMLLSEAVDTLRCFEEGLHYLHYHYKALVTFFDNAARSGAAAVMHSGNPRLGASFGLALLSRRPTAEP